jgi:hypothetical protein
MRAMSATLKAYSGPKTKTQGTRVSDKLPIYKVFIGGGFDDWISGIIKSYEANYRALNPTLHSR